MMNNLDVMMLTCDKNQDIWDAFFELLQKYWSEYNGKIFVNTESLEMESKQYELIFSKEKFNERTPWSLRFYKCLEQLDKEYVLLIMDDFLLCEQTEHEELLRCLKYMDEDRSIACFNFATSPGKVIKNEYGRYGLKDRKAAFRMNLQVAIWRRERLMKFIRTHENPWQFETWGSMRNRRYSDKIYHLNYHQPKVFHYLVGGVLADGKWRGDESVAFLKKEGFHFDFLKSGIYHEGEPRKTEIVHRTFMQKIFQVIKSLV